MNMRENTCRWAVISLILVITCGGAFADKTIYVDDDAAGANDGSSWADAYKYLQDALADAGSADKPVEIRVAQGIYRPDRIASEPNGTGDRTATFQLISGVALRGGYVGFDQADPNVRDIEAYETILSGDLPGEVPNMPTWARNIFHLVTCTGTDETAVLDGFTITAGGAYHPASGKSFNNPNNRGGGMYNYEGSPTVNNCTFSGNSGACGGGMCNWFSSPNVVNCTFTSNSAELKGYRFGGGGMYNFNSSPTLVDCTLSGNYSDESGGGMYDCEGSSTRLVNCTFTINSAYRGGGIDTYRSNSELTGCTFIANSAKSGGGLSCLTGKLTLTGCSFIGNSVSDNGGGIYFGDCDTTIVDCFVGGNRAEHHGGGIYCGSSGKLLDNRIIRCVITGNKAGAFGGGIYCSDNLLSISNCAVVGNFAERCGGLLCGPPTSGLINNCILWDNRDKEGAFESAQIYLEFAEYRQDDLVNYCCIKGLIGELDGIGNISAEPCFAETGYWDPNGKPEDVNDDFWVDGDYHLKSQAGRWDPSTADWIKDDVTSPCIDVGNPAYPIGPEPFPNGGVINMGAYGGTDEASESYFGEPVCETIVAGDINGDCSVDFLDLLFISQHWLLHEIGKASNPFPPDGAARVSSGYGDRLSWTAGVNAVSHDLYFGTDRMSVADAHRGSPEYKGNHSITRYIEWGLFKPKTTHYWRIDEIGYLGKTTGTVWSFTKID